MPHENLSSAFSDLGRSLSAVLKAAWDRPERQEIQAEIEDGLQALGVEIRKMVDEIGDSKVGQELKTEADRIRSKVAEGEYDAKVRSEVHAALQRATAEMERLAEQLKKRDPEGPEEGDPAGP